MRISTRFTIGLFIATAVPSAIIGTIGYVMMEQTANRLVNTSSNALLDSSREQIQTTVNDKADKISRFLSNYQDDVNSLRFETELNVSRYPKLTSPYLSDLYPDKDTAGLPAYGYVSPRFGAFANWDHREYAGSVWIRKGVLNRARNDIGFRNDIARTMQQIMPINPSFAGVYNQRKDSCELVWIVTNVGVACSYPNDYAKSLIANPAMNELDESKESYVVDYNPVHNPNKETRWMSPYVDAIKKKWMTSCVAPLYDRDRFMGTIGVDVLLGTLTDWLQAMRIKQNGYVFMLSAEGVPLALPETGIKDLCWDPNQQAPLRVILHNQRASILNPQQIAAAESPLQNNPNIAIQSTLKQMMKGHRETRVVRLSGEDKLIAFAPVLETGWRVGIVLPVSEANEPVATVKSGLSSVIHRALLFFFTVTGIITILVAMLGSMLGYRMSNPIARLINSIDALGREGNWHEVSAGTRDELQLLADSVNRMVSTILDKEARLRVIFNGVQDAIFIHDAHTGEILDVNQRMCDMYGYTTEEACALDVENISSGYPPYTHADAMAWMQQASNGGNPVFEWHAKDKDGRLFWVEVNMSQANIAGRECIAVVARDIEERKRAEEALNAEKERLAVTLHSIGDGVIATDVDGRVRLMNRVAEELTGWNRADAEGRPLAEIFTIIDETTRDTRENPVQKVLSTGLVVELANHTSLIARDGVERSIADSGAPIRDSESRIVGVVLVFRDVTQELKLKHDIQRMTKLDSLSVMAGGIAHDFNNLLTAISGNMGLAQMALEKQDNANVGRHLKEAENASMRAKDLSLQLLTFAKGSAPMREIVLLPPLLTEAAAFALTGSRCKCNIDAPPTLWPVLADAGQLNQVVNNLILNAMQAMPDGGQISVKAVNQTVDDGSNLPITPGAYVCLEIADQGTGIPEDVLPRIFDPFFTTKLAGNGLGLASVYSIIRNHDGHISVKSKMDEGTVFTVLVPAKPGAVIRDTIYNRKDRDMNAWRIILMDDETMISDMVRQLLESVGHHVTTVDNGADAISEWTRARENNAPFDLAIFDLTIPGGIGGKEVIEHLHKIDPDFKAIASSGYATDPIMADYQLHGFAGRIAKPYRVKELLQMIAEMQHSDAG